MNRNPQRDPWVIRVIIVFVCGDLATYISAAHPNVAFTGGALLGVVLQAFVPQRSGWKQTALIALVVLMLGIVRSFFH